MQPQEYISLYDLEDDFWWFVGMREITAALLDPICANSRKEPLVVDVGCGTGANLEWHRRYTTEKKIIGIDLMEDALSFCRRRGRENLIQASATDLPLADATADLVTSFDVLACPRGANADEVALNELYRILRPGGIAFVRAAAYSWMRGEHDRATDSIRRFTLSGLREKMTHSGFEILRATYANTWLLPVAAIRRLVLDRIGLHHGSDVKPLPPGAQWLNRALKNVLTSEARVLKHPSSKLPAGLSAICIARKPDVQKPHREVAGNFADDTD
jgi:ubiquinone/menaquinone biosynthesis C-methylase UbiE